MIEELSKRHDHHYKIVELQRAIDLAIIAMASGESGHAEGILLSVASKEARKEYEEIVG